MITNLNPFYRCTRKRIPRSLLTVGTCFCYRPIRRDAVTMSFVRRVVFVDYRSGEIVDQFGIRTSLSDRPVFICVPR